MEEAKTFHSENKHPKEEKNSNVKKNIHKTFVENAQNASNSVKL